LDPVIRVLNYFNYFTEIERFFQTKRATFTLLSTLDWVLIENWKEQGIPLDVVLKGIDRTFERSKSKERIGSLAYCAKAVAQVCEESKDLRVEKPELPDISSDQVAAYVEKLASGVEGLSRVFPEFGSRIAPIAAAIRSLRLSNLRDAEQQLSALEEKIIALIKVASDDAVLLEVKRGVDADLTPFRSTMTVEQLTMLEQQLWRRKLMERFEVPRLSLFYLM
jgi:hypothetical protein